jgi:hypothetical protein
MFFLLPTEIAEGIAPRHRFMSAYEQKVEPPDRKWQYLLFAAEPYETIAFKVGVLYLVCFYLLDCNSSYIMCLELIVKIAVIMYNTLKIFLVSTDSMEQSPI